MSIMKKSFCPTAASLQEKQGPQPTIIYYDNEKKIISVTEQTTELVRTCQAARNSSRSHIPIPTRTMQINQQLISDHNPRHGMTHRYLTIWVSCRVSLKMKIIQYSCSLRFKRRSKEVCQLTVTAHMNRGFACFHLHVRQPLQSNNIRVQNLLG